MSGHIESSAFASQLATTAASPRRSSLNSWMRASTNSNSRLQDHCSRDTTGAQIQGAFNLCQRKAHHLSALDEAQPLDVRLGIALHTTGRALRLAHDIHP